MNPAAQGNEVWLASITTDRQVFSTRLWRVCSPGWRIVEGNIVSPETLPSEIVCHVRSNGPILIKLGMHPWAGIMSVVYEGSASKPLADQDLYSAEGDTLELSLPVSLTAAERIAQAILILANCISLAALLLGLTIYAINRPLATAPSSALKSFPWWGYALILAGAWLFYLVVFWPGFFTTDAYNQFEQITLNRLDDWHPAFHTMSMWLITRAWFSPAAVILVQIASLSALLGVGFAQIVKRGAPSWLAGMGLVFLGFSPGIAWILLNPWKDVAYSICLVGLTLLIFLAVASHGRTLERPVAWIGIGILVAFSSLYRHNGGPGAFASLIVLAIGFPKQWKTLLGSLIVAILIFVFVKGPLYSLANVNTNSADPMASNPGIPSTSFLLLDYQRRSGIPLDPSIAAKMAEVLSKPTPRESLFTLGHYGADFNQEAKRMVLAHPVVAIGFAIDRSKFIFQALPPPLARLGYVEPGVDNNPFGFHIIEFSPGIKAFITRLAFLTETPYLDWLFWRNAFWMNALILGAVVAWVRTRNIRMLLMIVPVLFNAIPLAIFSGGHIARYILPTLLIGPWLAGFLLLINPVRFFGDPK